MPPYRFDITHSTAGRYTMRCGCLEADSEWGLARKLVEDDAPDAPIEAGREGRLDWTFPSLHRFAVGAVRGSEGVDHPERLHPALMAAVVATAVARAKRRVA
jgi:hypothetical protein